MHKLQVRNIAKQSRTYTNRSEQNNLNFISFKDQMTDSMFSKILKFLSIAHYQLQDKRLSFCRIRQIYRTNVTSGRKPIPFSFSIKPLFLVLPYIL